MAFVRPAVKMKKSDYKFYLTAMKEAQPRNPVGEHFTSKKPIIVNKQDQLNCLLKTKFEICLLYTSPSPRDA